MRAVIYSTVLPAIVGLNAAARSVGIEPVAVIDEGANYAAPFGEDYATLDPARPRADLEGQVRASSWMFASPVVGPVAEIGGRRLRVLAAALDDPGDADTPRLDASDGPLWLTSVEPL